MRTYDYDKANELAYNFKRLTNIDFTSKSRKTEEVFTRTLFYKILIEKNNMNDRMITDWFKSEYDTKRNRSAIYQSLQNIDLYYTNYKDFRDLYDAYFDDRVEQRRIKEEKQNKIQESTPKPILAERNESIENVKKNALKSIIDGLPDERLEEIREVLSLRIKSWEWKYKDRCEIIDCSGSLSGFAF